MRPKPLMATLTLASVTTLTLACDELFKCGERRQSLAHVDARCRVSREPPDRVIGASSIHHRTYLGRGARGGRLAEVTRERGARGEFDSLHFAWRAGVSSSVARSSAGVSRFQSIAGYGGSCVTRDRSREWVGVSRASRAVRAASAWRDAVGIIPSIRRVVFAVGRGAHRTLTAADIVLDG